VIIVPRATPWFDPAAFRCYNVTLDEARAPPLGPMACEFDGTPPGSAARSPAVRSLACLAELVSLA
jgi:hypothetical protein